MSNEKGREELESSPKRPEKVRKPAPGEIIDFMKRRQLMDLEIPVRKFIEEMSEMDPIRRPGWYVLCGPKFCFVVREEEELEKPEK